MGLNFAKEITVFKEQIYPQGNSGELSELQVLYRAPIMCNLSQ